MEVPGGHNNKANVILAEFVGCCFMMMALNWSSVNQAVPSSVGFMLTILTQLFGDISGAHFNPAVTFGMLFKEGSENWMRNFTFTIMLIIVQGIGYAFGAVITSGGYSWAAQKDKKIPPGGYNVAQICPSHDCADGGSMMRQVFYAELGCTFLFINFIFMIKKHTPEPADGTSIQPVKALLTGIVYYLCVTMASGMSGGMLNPAIGMIQSLYQKFANSKMYPEADDVGTVYLVVYMFSPFIGAFFAGLWHKWSHESNLKSAVNAQEGEREALLSGTGGRKHRRVNPRIERRKQPEEGADGNKPSAAERKAKDDERRKEVQAKQAEQKKKAAEKAAADKQAADAKKKADADAKAKAAADKKAADDAKKAEAKRQADEKAAKKKADQDAQAAQKKAAADKAAEDKKAAAAKAADDKKAADAKKAEQKKIDDEKKAKAAEEKKVTDAKKAEEKKVADAKKAEQKKIDDEKKAKAAEEKKVVDAKKAEEKKAADAKKAEEKAVADKKKAEEKAAADKKKAEQKPKEEKASKDKKDDKGSKAAAAKEEEEEKQQEEEKPDLTKPRTPDEPINFQFKDVLHNGKHGVSNKYWSFMDADLSMRIVYEKNEAMPVQFFPYKGMKDVYTMKCVYPGYDEKWISFTSKDAWLYASYDKEEEAMPVKFVQLSQNNNGSFKGICYKMQNYYGGKAGKWISFTNDGQFLKATYKESDADIFVLEQSEV